MANTILPGKGGLETLSFDQALALKPPAAPAMPAEYADYPTISFDDALKLTPPEAPAPVIAEPAAPIVTPSNFMASLYGEFPVIP
jgi:hypothetical protein